MHAPIRFLAVATLVAAVAAPTARADGGPSPGIAIDGRGVADAQRGLTYATSPAPGGVTGLEARTKSGKLVRSRRFDEPFGIPLVTFGGDRGGLSPDGQTLFLGEAASGTRILALETRLIAVDTATLRTRRTIDLAGDFSFDAVAPDGRTLFLIQHSSARDIQRYRVRAYDLTAGRLLPGAIVDKREPQMAGIPVARVSARGGSWAYTLYSSPSGEPFVHALDTVHRDAYCLDVHWEGDQALLWTSRLSLRGDELIIRARKVGRIATLRLPETRAQHSAVGPAAAGSAAVLVGAALGLAALRRRRLRASS